MVRARTVRDDTRARRTAAPCGKARAQIAMPRATAPDLEVCRQKVEHVLLHDAAFRAVCRDLAPFLVSAPAYERPGPKGSLRPFTDWQLHTAAPHSPQLLVAEVACIRTHIAEARRLPSPFGSCLDEAQQDLRDAVSFVASFHGDPEALRRERNRRIRAFAAFKDRLSETESKLRALSRAGVREVLGPDVSVAFTAAALRVSGSPDWGFTACQVHGFPVLGDVPDSGMFRLCERPAEHVFGELNHRAHNAEVENRLRARSCSNDAEVQYGLEYITVKTREEVANPSCAAHGPFTSEEVDGILGKGEWRAMEGFAVAQGLDKHGKVKCRRCDNAKASQTNACATTHETNVCISPTFPVLASSLFAEAMRKAGVPMCAMAHGTDDVELAYRRIPCAHPEATVVAIWDTVDRDVRYYTMGGHNFGIASAVINFNRASQLGVLLARRLLGVCCAAYFDDFNVTEPVFAGSSAKGALHWMCAAIGIPLSADKNVPMARANPFLGVVTDLERTEEGVAVMRPKPERISRIVVRIEQVLASGVMNPPEAASMAGKLEFTARHGVAGRLGRAALAALREFQVQRTPLTGDSLPITPQLREALAFYRDVLPVLPPRDFPLLGREVPPVLVYTDAMYEVMDRESGRLGLALFDPLEGRWYHSESRVPSSLLDRFQMRQQYVGQLEVLAAVAAYTTFSSLLRGREVVHFIDNTGALFGLMKGYARDVDSARLVHSFHTICAAMGTRVWLAYVASKANLADLPSRGSFELLEQDLGSTWAEFVLPPLQLSWSGSFAYLFDAYAGVKSQRVKRARQRVQRAVQGLRKRHRRAA